MTNKEWLVDMGLEKFLSLLSQKCEMCLLYKLTDDYSVMNRCPWDCDKCLTKWLNSTKKSS